MQPVGFLKKELSSKIAFKGILKKMAMLITIAVGVSLDLIINADGFLRGLVLFFYIGLVGISILENSATIGVPIPDKLRKLNLLIILVLIVISVSGCGEIERSEDKDIPLDGYSYNEQTERYINNTTGVWYIVDENGYKLIPAEQYFDPDRVGPFEAINIADRPDYVWEISEILDITVQPGDTLVEIINPYFMNEHFRINPDWYTKQILELNNIFDSHFIQAGDTLKLPIYIDIGSKQ